MLQAVHGLIGGVELLHGAFALAPLAVFGRVLTAAGLGGEDGALLLSLLLFAAIGAHNVHDAISKSRKPLAGLIVRAECARPAPPTRSAPPSPPCSPHPCSANSAPSTRWASPAASR
jgi:hypothetical protein